MSDPRAELTKTPTFTLVLTGALAGLAALSGCDKLSAAKTNPEELKLFEDYDARVQAFAAAAGSVPADLPALSSAQLPAPLKVCGSLRCDDGSLGNTNLVADAEALSRSNTKMLEAVKAGKDDSTLSYKRKEGFFEAMPEVAYFVLAQAEQEQKYEEGKNASWRGSLAVWDAAKGAWVGSVGVDLTGPEPSVIVTNVEFGPGGSQTITYVDDESGDRSRAQTKFDQILRQAQKVAVTGGVDVTRPEQALRGAPRDAALELPAAGVIVVDNASGAAGVLSAQGMQDLALNEVTDVVATPSGVAFQRAANALGDGVSDLVVIEGKTLHDARSWLSWGASRNVRLRLDEGQLWMFDSVDGDRAGYWTGSDWSYLDAPELGELSYTEVAKGSAGAALLGIDGKGGSRLHLQQGGGWSSVDLEGQPKSVAALGETTYVGTTAGLWQLEAGAEPVRLAKGPSGDFTEFAGGLVVSSKRKIGDSKRELVRVAGSELSRLGLKLGNYDEFAVGPSGEVAATGDGGLSLAAPGAERVAIEVEGKVESLDFDGKGRLWIGTDAGVHCWSAGKLSPVAISGVESVRIVRAIGEGLDPSTIAAGG